MTDMEGMMPQLTLNADAAKVETPTLTLGAEPPAAPAAVRARIYRGLGADSSQQAMPRYIPRHCRYPVLYSSEIAWI